MDLNSQELTTFRDEQISFIDSTFERIFNRFGYVLDSVTQQVLFYREPEGRQIGFGYSQRGSHIVFDGAGFLPHNGAGHGDAFRSIFEYLAAQHSVDLSSYSFNNPARPSFYTPMTMNEVLADWYEPVISQPDFSKKLCEWLLDGEPEDEAEVFFAGQLSYLYRLSRLEDGFEDVVGSKLDAKSTGSRILNIPESNLKVDHYPEVSAFLVYDKTETSFVMISFDGTYLVRSADAEMLDFFNAHASGERSTT